MSTPSRRPLPPHIEFAIDSEFAAHEELERKEIARKQLAQKNMWMRLNSSKTGCPGDRPESLVSILLHDGDILAREVSTKNASRRATFGNNFHPQLISRQTDGTLAFDERCVRKVIDREGGVNVRNSDGDTALHWACNNDVKGLAKFLISYGGDILMPNKMSKIPLDYIGKAAEKRKLVEWYESSPAAPGVRWGRRKNLVLVQCSVPRSSCIAAAKLLQSRDLVRHLSSFV
jgi:hypothetical protein